VLAQPRLLIYKASHWSQSQISGFAGHKQEALETYKGHRTPEDERMEDHVKREQQGQKAVVTLNRPRSYNSFNLEMVQQLAEMLVKLSSDQGVAGVVITGEGKAFCAGGDLRWVAGYGTDYGAAFHALAAAYHQAVMEIRGMPKPVVAAINGLAAGGGFSLALACDFRIMETSATLRQGYTSNGLSIDGGGTFTLPRLVGMAKAMEIATFDPSISSEQAQTWGLVTEIVQDGGSLERSLSLIDEIIRRPLDSFAASKKLITGSFNTSFEAQLEKEREYLSWCGRQPNGREGITAFLEKRKPAYNKV
jgi:2-(1,2-epoxy-1,2-dihydrophenyl)acetyl-CoA isomerase